MNETTIPIKPTLARKRALMLNDALPGFLLLVNGLTTLGEVSAESRFAYLNIVSGMAVILALVYEFKRRTPAGHGLVSKFDIIAGLVLMVDALNRHHPGRIFQPATFFYLIGLFTILRGVFHSRFPNFRRLLLNDNGFDLRIRPFKRLQMEWKDVEGVELNGTILSIKTRSGEIRAFNLSRVGNRGEVVEGMKRFI